MLSLNSSKTDFICILFYIWSDFISIFLFVQLVNALAQLQEQYPQLHAWSGDPCLPTTFNWEWVGCSSDATLE